MVASLALLALAVLVVVVLVVAHVVYWRRRLFVPTDYAHEPVLDTEDGCTIVLPSSVSSTCSCS